VFNANDSVANGCFLLTSGRLADLYGRRRVFFVGAVMYLIFTILCGISQNGIMLFLFRGFQGIGGAIQVPGAVGIVGATYHKYDKRKAVAFSIIGGMATTGFLAGILLGGICAQLLTWRWLFFITAMISGAMILSTFFIVPKTAGEDESNPRSRRGKYKEIDWFGQLFSISGLVLLAFSLTYSSEAPNGWGTWYIIFLLILSIILLGLFIFVEHKRGSRAMMPLKIWKSSQFSLSMFILFFGWMDFEIVTLYMTFLYIPHSQT
jgi:MFS family permease